MNATLVKCPCNNCSGHLEFEAEHAGTVIACPHCGLDTTLFIPQIRAVFAPPSELDPKSRFPKYPRDAMFCPNCGTVASPRAETRGSFAIELILWLFMCLPGLIYSVWRLTTRCRVCPSCGNESIIPPGSPRAQQLLNQ